MTTLKRVKDIRLEADQPLTTDGWVEAGLLIHKVQPRGSWHVTHVASGCFLDRGYDSSGQARAVVEALIGMGLDFTREKEYLELHREEILDVLVDVRDKLTGARYYTGDING